MLVDLLLGLEWEKGTGSGLDAESLCVSYCGFVGVLTLSYKGRGRVGVVAGSLI